MKKISIPILFLILVTGTIFGQQKDKDYYLVRNLPDIHNNLLFTFSPTGFDIYNRNPNMFYGIGLTYNHQNKLKIDVDFKQAYLDRRNVYFGNTDNFHLYNNNEAFPINESKPFTSLELMGSYTISDFLKSVTRRHITSSAYNANTYTHYYIPYEVDEYHANKLRFGLNQQTTTMRAGYWNGLFGTYYSDDYVGYRMDRPYSGYIANSSNDSIYSLAGFGQVSTTTIIVGYSSVKQNDEIIKLSNGKMTRLHSNSEWYVDVLFALNINIQDLIKKSDVYYTSYGLEFDAPSNSYYSYRTQTMNLKYSGVNENTKKSPIGFRVGWKYHNNKSFGWTHNVEAGVRPGIGKTHRNFYFVYKLGLQLSKLI